MCDDQPVLQIEKIKNFAISMILNAFTESTQENIAVRTKLQETISEIFNVLSEIEYHNDEHIKIAIASIIEGVLIRKETKIDYLQKQADFLVAKLNYEKQKLREEMQLVREELTSVSETKSNMIRQAVRNVLAEMDN